MTQTAEEIFKRETLHLSDFISYNLQQHCIKAIEDYAKEYAKQHTRQALEEFKKECAEKAGQHDFKLEDSILSLPIDKYLK